jgi:uncharacterized membrane-anchored protein
MKKLVLLLPLLLGLAAAKTAPAAPLKYQTSPVTLLGGKVGVQASSSLRYLDAAESRRVIVDLWGNPPSQADDVLGMLIPGGTEPDTRDGWAIVMTENRDGHVGDGDAASTNYTQLLSDMQSGVEGGNAERTKAGYEPIRLVGWAEPPSYDAVSHKMIWAKELAFGDAGAGDHTLNYAVRVLGRDDVLELNAVGAVSQLPQIKQGMQEVLPLVTFTPGNRYTDYKEGSDKLATYGIAGLVAGGFAAKKLGLLALLPLLIKKGWIVIVLLLGVISRVGGFFRNLFAGRGQGQPVPSAAGGAPTPPFVHPDLAHRQGSAVDLSKPGDSATATAQDRPAGRHGSEGE